MSRIARILALILVVAVIAVPAADLHAQNPGLGPYTEVRTLGRGMVRSVAWNPRGDVLAVGGVAGIWLYGPDLADAGLLRGHTKAVYGLAFSPDGSRLASASHDRTVRVWDVAARQELLTLEGHTGLTVAVAWQPAGSLMTEGNDEVIISGGEDSTIRFWDPATGAALRQIETGSWVNALAFSPDGSRFASAQEDGSVRLWETATGREIVALRGHTDAALSAAWGAGGESVISAGRDAQTITWDAANGGILHVAVTGIGAPTSTAWSPDRSRVVVAAWNGGVSLRDAATGEQIAARDEHMDWITALAWDADGTIRCAGLDGLIRTWNAAGDFAGAEVGDMPDSPATAMRPDGARFAAASPAGVTITGAANGEVIAVLPGPAITAAWSADGRQIAVALMNGTIKIWGEA